MNDMDEEYDFYGQRRMLIPEISSAALGYG